MSQWLWSSHDSANVRSALSALPEIIVQCCISPKRASHVTRWTSQVWIMKLMIDRLYFKLLPFQGPVVAHVYWLSHKTVFYFGRFFRMCHVLLSTSRLFVPPPPRLWLLFSPVSYSSSLPCVFKSVFFPHCLSVRLFLSCISRVCSPVLSCALCVPDLFHLLVVCPPFLFHSVFFWDSPCCFFFWHFAFLIFGLFLSLLFVSHLPACLVVFALGFAEGFWALFSSLQRHLRNLPIMTVCLRELA